MKNLAFHVQKESETRSTLTFYYVGGHNDRVIKVSEKGFSTEAQAREAGQMESEIELTSKPEVIHADHSDAPIYL